MNGLRNTNLHDKENIDKSAEKVGSNIELKKYNKPTVEGYDGENEEKIITYFQSNGTFKTDLGSQTLADAALQLGLKMRQQQKKSLKRLKFYISYLFKRQQNIRPDPTRSLLK